MHSNILSDKKYFFTFETNISSNCEIIMLLFFLVLLSKSKHLFLFLVKVTLLKNSRQNTHLFAQMASSDTRLFTIRAKNRTYEGLTKGKYTFFVGHFSFLKYFLGIIKTLLLISLRCYLYVKKFCWGCYVM